MAEKDIAATPMMRQFYDLKAKHPDAVLLFRCGDFYETYCSDAIVASEILGITLTKRSNGKSDAAKDRKSTRLNSSHNVISRMPSSA